MLLVILVIIALLIGRISGGKLSNLDLADLRLWWLAPIGLALQLAPLEDPWAFPALMVSYLVLCLFAAVNLRRPGMALVLAGLAMNWLVIGLNEGMPVDISALGDAAAVSRLEAEGGAKHHVMTDADELAFLGDTLWIPRLREVYSPGDLALYVGVAWFIAAAMRTGPQARRRQVAADDWGAEDEPPE
jgi:hypothetical protein